ncbi:MAG: A/G-specific adenine glycosylase [Gammaproteobacteria bacterium]
MSETSFSDRVLKWFESNGRKDLPWQLNPTPYRVWISEVMLQQTQVATVIPYFERFTVSYPGVGALADAHIDDVLHHWSGLGYYARARNLHKAAQRIVADHGGEFPVEIADVLALPGIGRSTAGAILALSRNERHPILDGNVKRVLARQHAVEGWPGTGSIADELWQLAEQYTPADRVAEYTQAMMDIGATLCKRTVPLCNDCPVAGSCRAHTMGRETDYPGRKPKKEKPLKKTQMLLVCSGDEIYMERRPASGIWGGLWSFPELDSGSDVDDWCQERLNVLPVRVERWNLIRHSFTHFDLDIQPIAVRTCDLSSRVADSEDCAWYNVCSPLKLGIAAPVSNLIQQLKEQKDHVPNS